MNPYSPLFAAARQAVQHALGPDAKPIRVVIHLADGNHMALPIPEPQAQATTAETVPALSEMEESILTVLGENEEPLPAKAITTRSGYADSTVWRIRHSLQHMAHMTPPLVKKERDGWRLAD